MAQVMKYWSNPINGTGSHDYNHYIYGNLSADFGATTYDWANMPHSISSSNTPIATLMYHCGVAVDMNYGTSSSGATLDGYDGACNAFKNYFKYDTSAYYAEKYQYEDSIWRNMILDELGNGRPIIYGGWGDFSGHAWNLDGYEVVGDLYHYHMNWGWGGSYNGYYYLDDLTPGSHNYHSGQEAIFNLYPYAANLVSCYPQNSNYWTGTTNSTTKTETSLVFGTDPEDGWMSFDVSAIPDGSTIYAVSFNGYVYHVNQPNWSITPVASDPVTTGAGVLHADIVAEQSSGYYFQHDESIINYPIDWRNYILGGDVCADLQSSLSSDKFTVGIANEYLSYTRYIRFDGWNEANPPYLNIYYALFGNIEGYVTEDGSSTPVEDVYVSISHYTDTTDSNGYYLIEDIPIGSYDIYVDANDHSNANGNPYFNDTLAAIITCGITSQQDFGLKWAEIELNPTSLEVYIDTFEIKTETFAITNNGPGDLIYSCNVEPSMGNILADYDIEAESGDGMNLYGCEFDGTYIWATGPVSINGDHQLYKFDSDGNLVDQFSQGTTSIFGMRKMTFDGTYLYSYDNNGFYRIDPGDGTVTTLFTEFPGGIYEPDGLAWVPGLGFVSGDYNEDFYVYDETGTLITRLDNSESNTYSDMTYDSANNCLWLAGSPNYTIYKYELETQSLTGLSWLLPDLEGAIYQSANGICFANDFFDNTLTICGVTQANPTNRFFALEVESWLQITGNRFGTVDASGKGSLIVTLELNAGMLTVPSKSADIIIRHNAGNNSVLTVTMILSDAPEVELKIFLEGPFNGSDMNTFLTGNPEPVEGFPLSQPYTSSPWNYSGTESVVTLPNNIVDWVLVDFRDATDAASANASTTIDRQAAFLLNNGFVVGLDGVSNLKLNSSVSEQLFVVICHRNHLDILSANSLVLSGGTYSYNFTTGLTQVYEGLLCYKEISPGIWGMVSGDGETNNLINNGDKNNSWLIQAGLSGYLTGDFNLDCNVGNIDKNDYWLPNIGKGSQMPAE